MTAARGAPDTGDLLRELAPQVLGALVRRYGRFAACEDAVQEAMLEAVTAWPARGVPESVDATGWPEILGLYELLEHLAPGPMVSLNRAVAVAMVTGPAAGLDLLDTLEADGRLAGHHRLHATRAHLLEMSGDAAGAAAAYREAARRTTSLPERRYLAGRAARLTGQEKSSPAM